MEPDIQGSLYKERVHVQKLWEWKCHTVDGRTPAPPTKPWNDEFPITYQPTTVSTMVSCRGARSGCRNHSPYFLGFRIGGVRRCWSLFPFTKGPFWVHFCGATAISSGLGLGVFFVVFCCTPSLRGNPAGGGQKKKRKTTPWFATRTPSPGSPPEAGEKKEQKRRPWKNLARAGRLRRSGRLSGRRSGRLGRSRSSGRGSAAARPPKRRGPGSRGKPGPDVRWLPFADFLFFIFIFMLFFYFFIIVIIIIISSRSSISISIMIMLLFFFSDFPCWFQREWISLLDFVSRGLKQMEGGWRSRLTRWPVGSHDLIFHGSIP